MVGGYGQTVDGGWKMGADVPLFDGRQPAPAIERVQVRGQTRALPKNPSLGLDLERRALLDGTLPPPRAPAARTARRSQRGSAARGTRTEPMRAETEHLVEEIEKSLALLRQRLGWETAEHRLEELNAMSEDPELWNDPARAQKLMRDRQVLADAIDGYRALARELADQRELIELGEAEGDAAVVAEAEAAIRGLRDQAAQKETEALLDGEADGNDTFLEINAGAGGTESCDWAAMLARMYVRWAEAQGHEGRADRREPGRGGGHPLGHLPDQRAERLRLAEDRESGVHRLVRISPFDSAARRHTSFSLGLGLSGGRRQHRDRGRAERHPHRHLPLVGRRRAAREHHQLGGAHHPYPDQHRGDVARRSRSTRTAPTPWRR